MPLLVPNAGACGGKGTGTEVLLNDLCRKEGVSRSAIRQTAVEVSHDAVATCVASGRADAGLCVETAAGADFVPLSQEDYFLIWRRDGDFSSLGKLLVTLRSPEWRSTAQQFAGVSAEGCGEVLDPASLGWRKRN